MNLPVSSSNRGATHPPRSNPPLRSSSGPPGPCITPSTDTNVVTVSFISSTPGPPPSAGDAIRDVGGERRLQDAHGLEGEVLREALEQALAGAQHDRRNRQGELLRSEERRVGKECRSRGYTQT